MREDQEEKREFGRSDTNENFVADQRRFYRKSFAFQRETIFNFSQLKTLEKFCSKKISNDRSETNRMNESEWRKLTEDTKTANTAPMDAVVETYPMSTNPNNDLNSSVRRHFCSNSFVDFARPMEIVLVFIDAANSQLRKVHCDEEQTTNHERLDTSRRCVVEMSKGKMSKERKNRVKMSKEKCRKGKMSKGKNTERKNNKTEICRNIDPHVKTCRNEK